MPKWILQDDAWYVKHEKPKGKGKGQGGHQGYGKGHGKGYGKDAGKGQEKGQKGSWDTGWHAYWGGEAPDKGKGAKGYGKDGGTDNGKAKGKGQDDWDSGARTAREVRPPKQRDPYVLKVPVTGDTYELQPGTYIACGGCGEWCYADKAGPGCEQCGGDYDWRSFFECRTAMPKTTEGTADVAMGGAQSNQAEPKAQGDGRAVEGKAKEEEAVSKSYREERDTRRAVTETSQKLHQEEQGLAGLGTKLESIMGQLKEQLEKMATKRANIVKLQEEQAEAEALLEKRKTARGEAVANKSAAQAARVLEARDLFDQCTRAVATSGAGDPPVTGAKVGAVGAASSWNPVPEPATPVEAPAPIPVVSGWAPLPAQAVGTSFPDSGGKMDKVNLGDDDEDCSDAETEADVAICSIDDWREHMVRWVFYAAHSEAAPLELVRYFCGEGEDAPATEKALGKVVDEIREKCWVERLAEASDMAAIQAVQDSGDMVKAYQMRQAQGMYAADKFAEIRAELLGKLDQGMEALNSERQGKVKAGKFVDAAGVKVATRRGAKKTKGTKTKQEVLAAKKVADVAKAKLKAANELKELKGNTE